MNQVEALTWIRKIAVANIDDPKLKAQGARTLQRIIFKCDEALEVEPEPWVNESTRLVAEQLNILYPFLPPIVSNLLSIIARLPNKPKGN